MIEKRSGVERRRFFRIDDRLRLAVRRVPGADDVAGSSGDFDADEFLAGIDRGIAAIIPAARVQAPAVGELAQLLNRKLDYVIERLGQLEVSRAGPLLAEHEVSISACGIGLQSAERYEAGETLQVELMLPPDDSRLSVPARVVRCRDAAPGTCRLQLDFAGMPQDDQEQLIQFIVRRQGQFLQGLREQRDARRARVAS